MNLTFYEQGRGFPVVFVHGGVSDYRVWKYQSEPLSEKYRVLLVNRRFAYPNLPDEGAKCSIDDNVADLVALLQRLGIQSAHFVGHSYSGFMLLRFALDHPQRVRSLVLAEPAIPQLALGDTMSPKPQDMVRLMRAKPRVVRSLLGFRIRSAAPMERALKSGKYASAMKLFLKGVVGKRIVNNYPAEMQEMMSDNARSLMVDSEPGGFPSFTSRDASWISAPTLILKGEISPAFLQDIADILAHTMPNSQQKTISGASHFMFVENPAECNRYIAEFLSKNSP